METRRSFRPMVREALEERVVMSHVGPVAASAIHPGATPRALPAVANTPSNLGPVGALGDDFTDEYRFDPPDRSVARNWVEILHATRLVSFGPFSLRSRGEPRDQGFAYNWARSGATSTDMIQTQLPGLTQQVAAGDVRYASIFIGTNDFLRVVGGVQMGLIPPTSAPTALALTEVRAEANFRTAVNTLLAANPNVRLVVYTIPDLALAPLARSQAAANPLAGQLLTITGQAIAKYNASIAAVAATNPRVALADLAANAAQAARSPTGTITFGGQTINLTTASDDYRSFFLADGLHVGTVAQGIIADLFALALVDKFTGQIVPPTPQEIVPFARSIQRHAQHGHAHP